MVDIQQVTVQAKMAILAHLNCRIRRLWGDSARREGKLRVDGEGRKRDFGERPRHERGRVGGVLDGLNGGVGWLFPMGGKGRHFEVSRIT